MKCLECGAAAGPRRVWDNPGIAGLRLSPTHHRGLVLRCEVDWSI